MQVYSGDDDDNCPTLGTMQWAYGLGLEQLAKWNPWYYDDALYGMEKSHMRRETQRPAHLLWGHIIPFSAPTSPPH